MEKQTLEELQRQHPFMSLSDILYLYLRDEIIALRLPPGERIHESRLAEQLEISRSPVKFAIDRLCEDALAERTQGRKTAVAPLTAADYSGIVDARIAVEGRSAYLAAKTITAAELSALSQLLKEFDDVKSREDHKLWASYDDQFHRIIVRASQNRYLLQMYEIYHPKLLRYRNYISANYKSFSQAIGRDIPRNYHRAIYFALKQGLSTVAADEITNDINRMRVNLSFLH